MNSKCIQDVFWPLFLMIVFLLPFDAYGQDKKIHAATYMLSEDVMISLRHASSFEAIFEKTREIKLNVGKTLIGQISQIDISSTKNLLVLDAMGPQLLLTNNKGDLIRKVDVSGWLPGIKWTPELARFSRQNSMVVRISGQHFLYIIDEEGKSGKKVPQRFPFQYRDII